MDNTFGEAGFNKQSGNYQRRSIIGSTLTGNLYEDQSVETYHPFAIPAFAVTVSLDNTSLKGMDADAVQARVGEAMNELKTDSEAVFGTANDKGTTTTFHINQDGQDNNYTDKDGNGDKTKSRSADKTTGAGQFGAWIGYTPELKSDADLDNEDLTAGYNNSILIPGTGEEGRLIGWYQYFSMRASKGWSAQDAAFYNKKIFDDRNSFIKSPTLKDVAMTGVSIAATLATGGMGATVLGAFEAAGITAGASIGTDALFTAADVAHGADAAQSWGNFGVRSLSTLATSALGAAGGSIMGQAATYTSDGLVKTAATGLQAIQGTAGVLARGGLNLAESVATRAASSSINAIHFGPGGSLSYDSQGLASQWSMTNSSGNFSVANYTGELSSIAGTFANAGLTQMTSGWDGSQLNGLNNFQKSSVATLGSDAGTLASMSAGYAMTGQTDLNVAGLDLGGQHFGLAELHIGSSGMSMNLGSGGVDVGGFVNSLQSAEQGLAVWNKDNQIAAMAKNNGVAGNETAFRSVYGFGDAKGQQLLDDLISGDKTIDTSLTGQDGKTVGNNVRLNASLLGGDLNHQLMLGTVLEHEAWRDGNNVGGDAESAKGIMAVMAHTGFAERVAGEYGSGFETSVVQGDIQNLEALKSSGTMAQYAAAVMGKYDVSGENMLVKNDGSVVDNGDRFKITYGEDSVPSTPSPFGNLSDQQIQDNAAIKFPMTNIENPLGDLFGSYKNDLDNLGLQSPWLTEQPNGLLKDIETGLVSAGENYIKPDTLLETFGSLTNNFGIGDKNYSIASLISGIANIKGQVDTTPFDERNEVVPNSNTTLNMVNPDTSAGSKNASEVKANGQPTFLYDGSAGSNAISMQSIQGFNVGALLKSLTTPSQGSIIMSGLADNAYGIRLGTQLELGNAFGPVDIGLEALALSKDPSTLLNLQSLGSNWNNNIGTRESLTFNFPKPFGLSNSGMNANLGVSFSTPSYITKYSFGFSWQQ